MRRAAVLVACAALVGAACGGASGPTELEVMVSGDPAELEAYRQVAAAYEERQDDVDVRLVEVTDRDELVPRLSSAIAAGTPPDLFLMNYRSYGQFQAKGAIEPVEDYLARDGGLEADAFYEAPMAVFRDDGAQTCLPQNASSLVVYYNEDLFEAAGIAPPAAGWAWDEMVDAALALTTDEDDDGATDVYGLGVDPEVIRVAPFVWSAGGELVDDPDAPTRFTFDQVASATALQAFLDLRSVAGVTPTDEEAEAVDLETRFLEGDLAMLMDSRKVVPTLRTIEDFAWDVAPLPVHETPATILHADAYCMTAGSPHHEEAWDFLGFALGPEGQAIAAATGRTVPSLVDVATSAAFLDPDAAPANSQVFLDNLSIARAVPHVATWPEIEDATNQLLEEAYYEPNGGEAAELIAAIDAVSAPLFARGQQG